MATNTDGGQKMGSSGPLFRAGSQPRVLSLLPLLALADLPVALHLRGHGNAAVTLSRAAPARTSGNRLETSSTRPAGPVRVTVIGDSVADEIVYLAAAKRLLSGGVEVKLELAPCRRLVAPSCAIAGKRPPTALQLVDEQREALGQVVVVAMGYNDYANSFPGDVRRLLQALRDAGVRHTVWLTLRATRHTYLQMNEDLRQLASANPGLTLADWNRYSRSHPSWFRADGLHLSPLGAMSMAAFIHRFLATRPAPAT